MRPFIGYAMKDMSDYNKTVSTKIGRQQGNDICTSHFNDTIIPIQISIRKIPL